MSAFEILVVILSILLGVFLVVGITIGILLVKVTLQIKRVTATAERTAESVESFMANVSKTSSKAIIGGAVLRQLKKFKKRGDR